MSAGNPTPGESAGPLLSICVPTYNRADLLGPMLEALLPQAATEGDRVEVWVSDDGSTDGTRRVVESAQRLGPALCSWNSSNTGFLPNVLKCVSSLARGEFVWVLGQHNLLMPGALRNVVEAVAAHRSLDALYANFRCATFPEHWPASAVGGYEGPYAYLGNPETVDRPVARWEELIRGCSALCTQLYAHIIRRRMWVEYWKDRPLGPPFSSALTSYPHSHMLADTMFGRPSYYIGAPAITIFNGTQSWTTHGAAVQLLALPELIRLYASRGLDGDRLREAHDWEAGQAYGVLRLRLPQMDRELWGYIRSYLGYSWRRRATWVSLWRAFVDSRCNRLSRMVAASQRRAASAARYFLHDWRPARWLTANRKGEG